MDCIWALERHYLPRSSCSLPIMSHHLATYVPIRVLYTQSYTRPLNQGQHLLLRLHAIYRPGICISFLQWDLQQYLLTALSFPSEKVGLIWQNPCTSFRASTCNQVL